MLALNRVLNSTACLVSRYAYEFSQKAFFRSKSVNPDLPKPGDGRCYRRVVHYPKRYTVEPIPYTRLGGRDPVTGRVVVKGIGGGIKHSYHWIDFKRLHHDDGSKVVIEKIVAVFKDGCRTANVALVAGRNKMRYILATENMKAGDIIKTSNEIPRIPVRASEGDAHPIGALPPGTQVNNVETEPGRGGFYAHAAGTYATIIRCIGDRVIVQLPSKHEISLSKECMAVVGRLSNVLHSKTPIGSAQKSRELGNRPRSGLWQRKGGRFGRKIRPLPPLKVISSDKPQSPEILRLTF